MPSDETAAGRCAEHGELELPARKVVALVTLLGWEDVWCVVHACEARLEIRHDDNPG